MSKPGTIIADMSFSNQNGQPVRLSDYRGKNIVLFSLPTGTSAAARQMNTIQRVLERFDPDRTVVFGVSTTRANLLQRMKRENRLSYDLVSDSQGQMLKVLLSTQPGYLVLDETGSLLESGSNMEPDACVENALRAVKIHTAVRFATA